MPKRSYRPCSHPGCGTLTKDGQCQAHRSGRDYDRFRGSRHQRGYGRRWEKLRVMILNRDPLCRACGSAPSAEVDHIVPKAKGGTDHPDNLQGLCKPCHSRKTATEDGGFGR